MTAGDGPKEEVEPATAAGGELSGGELQPRNLSCRQTVDSEWSSQQT